MFSLRKSNLFQLILVFAIALTAQSIVSAQVVYNWSSNDKVPEAYPKITRRQRVTFTITKVNNILFKYRLEVTENPIDSDDFKHLTDIFKKATGIQTAALDDQQDDPCSGKRAALLKAFEDAAEAINADTKLPVGYAGRTTHPSIPLSESIKAWQSHAPKLEAAVKLEKEFLDSCPMDDELKATIDEFKDSILKLDKLVNGPHVFEDDHVLSPGNNVSATVYEMYGDENVSSKTFTFPGVDTLTLSAGALFSRIPDYSYAARKSPLSTENVLTVDGNSKATPSIAALLNYSLGGLGLDRDNFGLALSAGPVIRLGGKSDASAFGFFSGISTHLSRRLFITPGIHFGQFSDFPVGFGNGSLVPANFGELTPVKRWTGRFGLAITFKTKDFSGLVSSETPKVTGNEAGLEGAKKKDPPVGDKDAITKALSQPVTRSSIRTARSERSNRSAQESRRSEFQVRPNTIAPSEAGSTGLVVTGINSSIGPADDQISINSRGSIRDYSTSFRGGRFYFVIPNARLDTFQDSLRGHFFRDASVEKRGNDLVLSLELAPGARVRVLERSNGLELLIIPSTN